LVVGKGEQRICDKLGGRGESAGKVGGNPIIHVGHNGGIKNGGKGEKGSPWLSDSIALHESRFQLLEIISALSLEEKNTLEAKNEIRLNLSITPENSEGKECPKND